MKTIRTLNYNDFIIEETAIGFQSYDKVDHKPLVFSQSEQDCSMFTEKYLAAKTSGSWV